MRKKSDRHRVVVVATPGAPDFELAIPAEVFGIDRSDITEEWYAFELVASEADLTTAHGLGVPRGRGLAAAEDADTLVIPACASVHDGAAPDLVTTIREAHHKGSRIVSLCSGAFVLAQAGLLDGRRATTHWMHADALADRYPLVQVDPGVLYVRDEQVWTSAGSAAALDMCLEIVRTDLGTAVANEVARRIVTPPHRDGGQAQFIRPAPATVPGESLGQALGWARSNLATVTVPALAARAGVSTRTLHRTLTRTTRQSPQDWLQRERILLAQQLLESTDLTLDAIAARTGLGTSTNLRAQFTRATGVPPSQYRHTFRPTG